MPNSNTELEQYRLFLEVTDELKSIYIVQRRTATGWEQAFHNLNLMPLVFDNRDDAEDVLSRLLNATA